MTDPSKSRFDWAISFSLANFLFWRDWINLFPNADEGGIEALYLGLKQAVTAYLAIPIFVVATAIPIWIGIRWLRRLDLPVAAERVGKFLSVLLVLGSPFVLFTFGGTLYFAAQGKLETTAPPSAATFGLKRTVVLLFDEMDIEERPAGFELAHLDRFRATSYSSLSAFSPNGCTLLAVPAMLTGEAVNDAEASSASELSLQLGLEKAPFSQRPQLFSDAKEAGARTAILGYFHPYCRLFGRFAQKCRSFSSLEYEYGEFPFLPLTFQSPWISKDVLTHRRNFSHFSEAALSLAADPAFDLVYLHAPFPRPPGISLEREGYSEAAYLKNLDLADQFLFQLTEAMKKSGVWDTTHLLVTSDHGYRDTPRALEEVNGRSRYLRVPFMVKFAGTRSMGTHIPPFSTLVLRDTVKGLLKGEISEPSQLAELLKRSAAPLGEPPRSKNEYCKLPPPAK